MKGVRVFKEKCNPDDAKDKSLPYSAYLVEYKVDDKLCFDIAMSGKAVDLFDYYYDLYKKNFIRFTQSAGLVNPKLWNDPTQPKKGKRNKK